MKHVPLFLALTALAAHAGTVVVPSITETYQVNTTITDNDLLGFSDTRSILGSGIDTIGEVNLSLVFNGGWNGDLYAYLTHDSGFAVLLNRPGRGAGFPDGSGSSGMNILFDDSAAVDVHTGLPLAGPATGTFQPDGRISHPLQTTENSPRSAFLSSFDGLPADGEWTLFVADVAAGDTSTLASWTLTINAVPEPSHALLAFLGCAALVLRRRRRP